MDFVPTGGKLSALAYATVSLFDVDRHDQGDRDPEFYRRVSRGCIIARWQGGLRMRVAAQVMLTAIERRRLETWASARSTTVRLVERSKIVPLFATLH